MKKIIALVLVAVLLTGCDVFDFSADRDEPKRGGLVMDGTVAARPGATDGATATQSGATEATEEEYKYGMASVAVNELNIRSGPGTNHASAGFASWGDRVGIVEIVFTEDVAWGCYENGWLCMDYVTLDDPSKFPMSEYGQWSALSLGAPTPVYTGPGYHYGVVDTHILHTILPLTGRAGQWYRTDKGWVNAEHIYVYGTETETPPVSVTVIPTDLNLRTHPNTTSPVIRTLRKGEKLNIFFKAEINGVVWGCTNNGWVCMDYVLEEGSNPLIGTWYDYEMNWGDTDFTITEYTFTKDQKFTKKTYTYKRDTGSMSQSTNTESRKYTYTDGKVFFDSERYGSKVTVSGDTLQCGSMRLRRGEAEDAVPEIRDIMAQAKKNAASNDPAILGKWLGMDYDREIQKFYVGGDYEFRADGTFVSGAWGEGTGTYDPQTGTVDWWIGTGSCVRVGIYTFDGSVLKLRYLGAEKEDYHELAGATIPASVEGDVLNIYDGKAYHGTRDEIVARLLAENATDQSETP